ncbi:MAG: hypothetical protein LBK83_12180 [Treponema sp.]|nr:hypothetical protein [Treponema sp.]
MQVVSMGGGGGNDWNSETLANTVYGGTNPGGAWVTVTFRSDGKMIGAFSGDNTSNAWDYVCIEGAGSITSSGWTPGAFMIPNDGKTLTFTNFGGHGSEREFMRLRSADLKAAASPADIAPLSADLAGSVWGGSTPAADNTSWLTLTFRPKRTSGYENDMAGPNVAVISYAHDSTTAVWDYSYDTSAKAGTLSATGYKPPDGGTTSWNPGNYTVSADGKTLTFTSFMGQAREFKRYYQMAD